MYKADFESAGATTRSIPEVDSFEAGLAPGKRPQADPLEAIDN
jgi:hypothetical protein